MAQKNVPGYGRILGFAEEADYGVGLEPTAYCQLETGNLDPGKTFIERLDNQPTRTRPALSGGKINPVFSFTRGAGVNLTPGNDVDYAIPLGSQFYKWARATACTISVPAVGGCTVSNAAAVNVGDLILLPVDFGGGRTLYFARQIATKVTTAITWYDDLPSAPVSGGTIPKTIQWYPYDDQTNAPSFTIWDFVSDRFQRCITGAKVNKTTLNFDNGGYLKFTFDGIGCDYASIMGELAIAGASGVGISDVDTTIPISSADCQKIDWTTETSVTQARLLLQIEDEVVLVTGFDRTSHNLYVTRGAMSTTPVAHADATEITPYYPTAPTFNSVLAPVGIVGHLETNESIYEFQTCGVTINDNTVPRNNVYGTPVAVGAYASAKREVDYDIKAALLYDNTSYLGTTVVEFHPNNSPSANRIYLQAGYTPGNIVALTSPNIQLSDNTAFETPPEKEVTFASKYRAIRESTLDDQREISITFC